MKFFVPFARLRRVVFGRRASSMKTRALLGLITFGIAASAMAISVAMFAQSNKNQDPVGQQTAPGHYVTPTAPREAVQQFLNPKLPAYPDFIAGEAVRSQLSPDGKTLAILCAGQNSLVLPNGGTDNANSTQFIFLYDVSGSHKQNPLLTQVIQQRNAHVGLVFSPDGSTLYAAGGRDDVVYVYVKVGNSWMPATPSATIPLGHPRGIGVGNTLSP